jgi:hypothetical protein
MNRVFSRVLTNLFNASLLFSLLFLAYGGQFPSLKAGVLATRVNLAVVRVLAQDKNTGAPLDDLRAEDFEVFDNDQPARIAVFRYASSSDLEPIALWLVAECPQKKGSEDNPSILNSDTDFLTSASKQLNPEDTIGVAHWCSERDEGGIKLAATSDRHAAEVALEAAFRRGPGELHKPIKDGGFQKMLSLIHSQTPPSDLGPRPVIVFLGPDAADVPRDEASRLARDVLSNTSLVIYGVRGGILPTAVSTSASRVPLISYLSKETGGQVLSAKKGKLGEALENVVKGLRTQYVLAFMPPAFNGEWHTVRVQLTASAIQKHPTASLRYRSGYPIRGFPPRYTVSEIQSEGQHSSDSSFSQLLEKPATDAEIAFEAEGATYEGSEAIARFTLKVGDERLSWAEQADGSYRSEITLATAFLSARGEAIRQKMQSYKIARSKNDSWTPLNERIIITSYLNYPANADHIRFVIRDDSSRRIGIQELPMRKVLGAPKLPNVIARQLAIEKPAA